MKLVVLIQCGVLVLTVLFGVLLRGDLIGGPRSLHQFFGLISLVVGTVAALLAFASNQTGRVKVFALLALFFTLSAGYAGLQVTTTAYYFLVYGQMAASGTVALIFAVLALRALRHPVR